MNLKNSNSLYERSNLRRVAELQEIAPQGSKAFFSLWVKLLPRGLLLQERRN